MYSLITDANACVYGSVLYSFNSGSSTTITLSAPYFARSSTNPLTSEPTRTAVTSVSKSFAKSFAFIHNQLEAFRDFLFYLPSSSPVTLPVDIRLKEIDEDFLGKSIKRKYLDSIKIHGTEIMNTDSNEEWYTTVAYDQFIDKLHLELCVPMKRLRISINEQNTQDLKLQIPMNKLLK